MVCNEEVFNWFKELSGAKRVELMCGLISMCIPLEIRFFGAIIQDLAKKDINTLSEAESKANNYIELESIYNSNLFADKANDKEEKQSAVTSPTSPAPAMPIANVNESNSSNNTITSNNPIVDENWVTTNGSSVNTTSNEMSQNTQIAPPQPSGVFSSLPSRSKLIVYLCLLNPSHRACSTLAYKALRNQLTIENVINAISHKYYMTGSYDDIYSEVLLLLTMAIHHPAFSYEQRHTLQIQKQQVESAIDNLVSQFRPAAHFNLPHINQFPLVNVHHQQYAHHNHNYIPRMPTIATPSSQLPNLSALHISNITSTAPHQHQHQHQHYSSSKSTSPSPPKVSSVAGISPIPMTTVDLPSPNLSLTGSNVNHFLHSNPQPSSSSSSSNIDVGSECQSSSCYNCGIVGHRGDECKNDCQDETTR